MADLDRARRLRAYRELAGLRTPGDLAGAMYAAGYKKGFKYPTVRSWEDAVRDIPDEKLEAIVKVCTIPIDFFAMDLGVDITKIHLPIEDAADDAANVDADERPGRGLPPKKRGRRGSRTQRGARKRSA